MNKNELLKCIQIYQFCAIDLNLYLDNFPENQNAVEDYCKLSAKLDSLIAEYEKNYGPLTNFGHSFYENPKAWVDECWPWDNEYKED